MYNECGLKQPCGLQSLSSQSAKSKLRNTITLAGGSALLQHHKNGKTGKIYIGKLFIIDDKFYYNNLLLLTINFKQNFQLK